MFEEEKDVNAVESSPTEDVVEDSSPQEPELAEPPAQEGVQTVPYDRFREVNEERKQLLQQVSQQQQVQAPQQPQADPYSGMSAEEVVFYRNLDARTEKIIEQKAQKLAEPLVQQNKVLAQKVAQMMEKDIKKENTDLTPEDEMAIAQKINMGYDMNDAIWSVMGPKRVNARAAKQQVKQQQKVQQKAQANLETSSVPTVNPLPEGKKLTFREKMEKNAKEMGF